MHTTKTDLHLWKTEATLATSHKPAFIKMYFGLATSVQYEYYWILKPKSTETYDKGSVQTYSPVETKNFPLKNAFPKAQWDWLEWGVGVV